MLTKVKDLNIMTFYFLVIAAFCSAWWGFLLRVWGRIFRSDIPFLPAFGWTFLTLGGILLIAYISNLRDFYTQSRPPACT